MTRQEIKNHLIYGLVRFLSAGMQALPLSAARGLGSFLGRFFFRIVPYERRKALRTLRSAFPEKSERELKKIASGAFANLGRGGAEFLRFPKTSIAQLQAWVAEVEGVEHLRAAADKGKGVVVATAHLGNWEVLAIYSNLIYPVGAIAQRLYDPRFDEALNQYRQKMGITVFPRNSSVLPILRWLKKGGVVGALADQDTNVESEFVEFFGRPAKTPSGPAWLAQASGAVLMTAFMYRRPDGRYQVVYQPEIPVPPRGQSLVPAVQEYSRRTEAMIRQHPEQWVWMHERWRTKPVPSHESRVLG